MDQKSTKKFLLAVMMVALVAGLSVAVWAAMDPGGGGGGEPPPPPSSFDQQLYSCLNPPAEPETEGKAHKFKKKDKMARIMDCLTAYGYLTEEDSGKKCTGAAPSCGSKKAKCWKGMWSCPATSCGKKPRPKCKKGTVRKCMSGSWLCLPNGGF